MSGGADRKGHLRKRPRAQREAQRMPPVPVLFPALRWLRLTFLVEFAKFTVITELHRYWPCTSCTWRGCSAPCRSSSPWCDDLDLAVVDVALNPSDDNHEAPPPAEVGEEMRPARDALLHGEHPRALADEVTDGLAQVVAAPLPPATTLSSHAASAA